METEHKNCGVCNKEFKNIGFPFNNAQQVACSRVCADKGNELIKSEVLK